MVHRLLCTYPAAAAAPDARGRLPLHLAFHEQGNIGPKGFEALLKAHPAAAMARDHSGRTSLHYACMSSSLKGSALRPGSAALPVPRTGSRRKSDTSDSVVALAAAAPKAAVVRDKNGHTPLHLALRRSAHLYVPELLEVAPEAAAVRDPRGRLPLLAACADGDGMVSGELAALVAALPAAAMERDWLGRTPLFLALGRELGRVGDEELAALIRAFPAAAAERNWIGRTALHAAVRNDHGSQAVVAALLRAHPAAADRDGLFCRTCDNFCEMPVWRSADVRSVVVIAFGLIIMPLILLGWNAMSPPTSFLSGVIWYTVAALILPFLSLIFA